MGRQLGRKSEVRDLIDEVARHASLEEKPPNKTSRNEESLSFGESVPFIGNVQFKSQLYYGKSVLDIKEYLPSPQIDESMEDRTEICNFVDRGLNWYSDKQTLIDTCYKNYERTTYLRKEVKTLLYEKLQIPESTSKASDRFRSLRRM